MSDGLGMEPLDLVDRAALGQFLAGCVPAYREMSIKLLAGGASNLTFLIRLDDRSYVLRRKPLGSSAPRAHDMQREFTVLNALQGRDLPVPKVFAYHDDDDVVGAPFYLMDFVEGLVVHSADNAKALREDQARECSAEMIRTLAQLHALEPADLQIPNFGKPDDFLRRRIRSWLRQWNAVEHRDFPDVERIGQMLLENVPPQQPSTLVHGDYRLGNVILDTSAGASVKAVLDWEMSTIGDPLTDLAHLLVYWESTRGRLTHPAQMISRQPGFLDGPELTGLYQAITGRDVAFLPFYLAFEHWRAAIIKDAIYLRRANSQIRTDEDLQSFGATVQLHLEEAAEILGELTPGEFSEPHEAEGR